MLVHDLVLVVSALALSVALRSSLRVSRRRARARRALEAIRGLR